MPGIRCHSPHAAGRTRTVARREASLTARRQLSPNPTRATKTGDTATRPHETELYQHTCRSLSPLVALAPPRPKAFSLMAGALERSESTSTSTLRMELMQGLVKMAWGTAASSRETVSPSGAAAGGAQPGSGFFGGIRRARLERQASAKSGSSRSLLERTDSESSRWSEVDVGSEGGESASSLAATPRGKAGGARDIFNMPYTEQASCYGWWITRRGCIRALEEPYG